MKFLSLFLAMAGFSVHAEMPPTRLNDSKTAANAAQTLAIFHQNDVIVFQGDSITDGGRQRTGQDFNHTMGQAYCYVISAVIGAQYPERNLTFINRGIGGNKVTDLARRWQVDTLDEKPDFLSILIGVNDTFWGGAQKVEEFEQVYDQLLADTLAALPQVKIVLCEPFVVAAGRRKANYPAEREAIRPRPEIVAKLAAKYHLPLVHFQKAFDDANRKAPPEHWCWDGVHPTYAGHGLMVQEWLRVVNGMQ